MGRTSGIFAELVWVGNLSAHFTDTSISGAQLVIAEGDRYAMSMANKEKFVELKTRNAISDMVIRLLII